MYPSIPELNAFLRQFSQENVAALLASGIELGIFQKLYTQIVQSGQTLTRESYSTAAVNFFRN